MSENRLGAETSPYLLQHKDNPVHWRAFSPEAFAEARAAGRPVLLSVGYAACHWCHVMAHESFEDEATARLMNAHFVNVKVDREERPDVDALYMAALHLLGEQGGWPLTMFLTPEGEPFWGGTYFPKESRWGRPSFTQVLAEIARIWREEGEKVATTTAALKGALAKLNAREAAGTVGRAGLDAAANDIARGIDPFHGGLGTAPKFPSTPALEALWRAFLRTGRAPYRDAFLVTLDNICQGGIYDHLGGGFSRYSVDRFWLVPHFEKMLYDNAGLVEALTLAFLGTGKALYRTRVEETVAWVLREMTVEGGGFAASLDADSEGEEGAFYLWTEEEVDRVLGPSLSPLFKAVYDVTPAGNFEGRTILNRLGAMEPLSAEDEARLGQAREKLFAAREPRMRPGFDDKVLSDWNGLMIAALARAALAFGRADWLAAAKGAFAFVAERMSAGDRLFHSFRAGRARHAAIADGYAHMARAALTLHEATGEASYLGRAEAWTGVLDRHFWEAPQGGYYLTADDGEALIARMRSAQDNPTPSANGAMISVLTRLASLTGDERYAARAEALAAAFAGEIERGAFGLGAYLNGLDDLLEPVAIVVVGDREEAGTRALLEAAWRAPVPAASLQVLADASALPAGHPAAGKTRVGGMATAYLCRGQTCSAPMTEAAQLGRALAPLASAGSRA
ncbi:MAG: thioredoxin domain-containing protein [Alphaproteobacteria bacterium]|nr:thioredoxin domain-containing protein [Alphaproteobacteria bacterium]